jgi:hypothetical protein
LSKFRKLMTVGGLAATLALVSVVGTLAPSGASSHREALQISQDPVADNTDTYAFVSPTSPTRSPWSGTGSRWRSRPAAPTSTTSATT